MLPELSNQTTPAPLSRGFATPQIASPLPETPIQQALKKVAETAFKTSTPTIESLSALKQEFKQLSPEISWKMAQLHALFTAIYQGGIATLDDEARLQELSHAVKDLSDLQKRNDLSQVQRNHLEQCLGVAKQALEETNSLIEAIKTTAPIQDELDSCCGALIDSSLDPLHPGETLLAVSEVSKSVTSLLALEQSVASIKPGSSAKKRFEEVLKQETNALVFAIDDWQEIAVETMEKERALSPSRTASS
jgi:hypothetical protein